MAHRTCFAILKMSAIPKMIFGLVALVVASFVSLAANASLLDCTKPLALLSGQECPATDNLPQVAGTKLAEVPVGLPQAASPTNNFHVNEQARSQHSFISIPLLGILLVLLLVRMRSFNSK
jgi:hypothetical protein